MLCTCKDCASCCKDAEIERLRRKLWACGVGGGLQVRDSGSESPESSVSGSRVLGASTFPGTEGSEGTRSGKTKPEAPKYKPRRGKAPLVDSYTGEDPAICWRLVAYT